MDAIDIGFAPAGNGGSKIGRRDFILNASAAIAASAAMPINSALAGQPSKKSLGQYFTPEQIASFMISLSKADGKSRILEPSSGEGVFIKLLRARGFKDITGYEIDPRLAALDGCVKCESFISADTAGKYDLVIGNPPYVRWKNLDERAKDELAGNALWNRYFNSLCDYSYIFMLKGVEALKEGGELIFICPEYWMNTTHSQSLRDYFSRNGYFSHFYIFNESPIFKGATVSTVVFRFVKSHICKKPKMQVAKFTRKSALNSAILDRLSEKKTVDGVEYMELEQFSPGQRWVFAQDAELAALARLMSACEIEDAGGGLFPIRRMSTIGDVCEIGNGMVSGLDKAFQIPAGTALNDAESKASIFVFKAKDLNRYFPGKATRYINVPDGITDESVFKKAYPDFYRLMQPRKAELSKRYDYGKGTPYWQWSFKRNEKLFARECPRILVPCKERISAKSYVRFALAEKGFYPTQDVTALFKKSSVRESIEYMLAYLNFPTVFNWIRHYGIVKGNIVEFSEKPLSNIPFRRIKWDDRRETGIHDTVTRLAAKLVATKDAGIANDINGYMEELVK